MIVKYDPLTGLTVTLGTTQRETDLSLALLELILDNYQGNEEAFNLAKHAILKIEKFKEVN